ncbi:hypothetical protein, partial [Leptospira bandrabouensis]|uniref:hypothetical protein n=1 Tax=Leptospira bandrabouensis TaxID=2484903 RepID=UPI001091055E
MFQFVRIITHPLYSVNEGVLKFFEEEFIPFFKEEDSKKKEKLYADLLRDINLKIKQKAENFFKKLDLDVKLDSCGTVIA